jgi:hypothetical protein
VDWSQAFSVLLDAVQKVGFPIVVALFVLVRLNGKLERVAVGLERLSERLERFLEVKEGRE